jgi:hypothetical protein
MASKEELDKLKENFEGSAAQRAGLTFNDYVKLVYATPAKTASPSKSKVTKSRGSNTAKQVGDQNQREWYNGKRYKAGGIVNTSTDLNGQMLKVAQKDKDGRVRASSQRAGGRGK